MPPWKRTSGRAIRGSDVEPKIQKIFDTYCPEGHPARHILLDHSRKVAKKALGVALQVLDKNPDLNFIYEAALLHDIGIVKTHAPTIGCTGNAPYIRHGMLGKEILEQEGLPRHALVCERHTGCGLSRGDIERGKLPLPLLDMVPLSLEEIIICYADKFFSKNPKYRNKKMDLGEILEELRGFGPEQLARFESWHRLFSPKRKKPDDAWQDEFQLIEKLTPKKTQTGILRGPGEDAALLASLKHPVISTDTQRESVHFNRAWMRHEELGYKAVMAAASDLAACYARPVALFVNLGLPVDEREENLVGLYKGMEEALKETGGAIAGGNISRSDLFSIDLAFAGEGGSLFPQRSGAREGEGIYSTGPLGEAGAGCHALLSGRSRKYPLLVERFKKPKARFDAAALLEKRGIAALMDISDGLIGDATHMARASRLTFRMEPEKIPISRELSRYAADIEKSPLDFILTGGEDYELLFTAEEGLAHRLARELPGMIRVGTCLPFDGRWLSGLPENLPPAFSHAGNDPEPGV